MELPDSFFYERFHARAFWMKRLILLVAVLVVFTFTLSSFFWRAPGTFPVESYLTVPQGITLGETGMLLFEHQLIRSPFWFKLWGIFLGGSGAVKAGDYYFDGPTFLPRLAWRVIRGDFDITLVKVLIPEGTNNRQIAEILARVLWNFDSAEFLKLAAEKEGYLFPDTYFFSPVESAARVIAEMEENFKKRFATLAEEIKRFKHSSSELIIAASLVEEEARTEKTRRTIAGILWKRLEAGMPLQVDAVFPYIFEGRPYDLTDGDLLVDSLYNTYKYSGLPPGPITNPGLDAIRATLEPLPTPYWFYLSDKNGNMHYAKTHEEHLLNRERFLGR